MGKKLKPSYSKLINYPFPLRADLTVHVEMPTNLTTEEAKKLGRFIETLVIKPIIACESKQPNNDLDV